MGPHHWLSLYKDRCLAEVHLLNLDADAAAAEQCAVAAARCATLHCCDTRPAKDTTRTHTAQRLGHPLLAPCLSTRRFLTYAESVMSPPIEPAVWAVNVALKLHAKAPAQARVVDLLKRVQYYAFLAVGCAAVVCVCMFVRALGRYCL